MSNIIKDALDQTHRNITLGDALKRRIVAGMRAEPRKPRFRLQGAIPAAACVLVVALALFAAPSFLGKKAPESVQGAGGTQAVATGQQPLLSEQAQAPLPTPDRKVVYGDGNDMTEQSVPGPGTKILSLGVSRALEDPANDGALFCVKLACYPDVEGMFRYEGKTMQEWFGVPEIAEYNRLYGQWLEDYKKTKEYLTNMKDDEQDEFREHWLATQDAATIEKTLAAEKKAIESNRAYSAWLGSQEYKDSVDQAISAEVERLKALGMDVKRADGARGAMIALLTKEQVESFPCGGCGYVISLADREEELPESQASAAPSAQSEQAKIPLPTGSGIQLMYKPADNQVSIKVFPNYLPYAGYYLPDSTVQGKIESYMEDALKSKKTDMDNKLAYSGVSVVYKGDVWQLATNDSLYTTYSMGADGMISGRKKPVQIPGQKELCNYIRQLVDEKLGVSQTKASDFHGIVRAELSFFPGNGDEGYGGKSAKFTRQAVTDPDKLKVIEKYFSHAVPSSYDNTNCPFAGPTAILALEKSDGKVIWLHLIQDGCPEFFMEGTLYFYTDKEGSAYTTQGEDILRIFDEIPFYCNKDR